MAVKNTNLSYRPAKITIPKAVIQANKALPSAVVDSASHGSDPTQIGAPPAVTPASSYTAVQPTVVKAPTGAATQTTPDLASDPIYQQQAAAIIKGRDDTLLSLTNEKNTIKTQYGIEDTTDPFSKAALLTKSLQDAIRGTDTSRFARGMGYDASTQHAQDLNQTGYNQSYDALTKAYNAANVDVENRKTNATNEAGTALGGANADALTRWLQTRPDPTTTPDATTATAAASTKNPYTPGTPQWAAYATAHKESWKTDSKGRWLIKRPSDGKFILP